MWERHWGQKMKSFSSYLKDLNLSKFSDIWTIKMCFNLLNVARKLFSTLHAKKDAPSALENLSSQNLFVYSTL
jgi:hypothetical protein